MKIPEWLETYHPFIINQMHPLSIASDYTVFHDCGKHLVNVVDEEGRVHYPDHANSSADFWLENFPEEKLVADLIRNDMFFHTCKSTDLESAIAEKDAKDLFTHLIVSLAEIHANAEIFGGIESTSFKSKFKQLKRRGNQLCKSLLERPSENYGHSYVFCRKDLSSVQRSVQSGHACWEASRRFAKDRHPSMVFVEVRDEKKLKKVARELIGHGIEFAIFREPLSNNEVTCIATEPLFEGRRELLKRFHLLKG